MKTRVWVFKIILACALIGGGPATAFAATAETASPAPKKADTTMDLMGKKLYRGTANAGLGWLEIPGGIQEIGNKHGVGAAATWGVVHGAGRAVQRTAVGLFEMLTFPFAVTEDYKPIIEPEFVSVLPPAPAPPAQESAPVPASAAPANTAKS